ncbi:MAG: hypothetical protein D6785_03335 [Planctomycetota bacterium]|nr:MAG: hypothetical protein D6785_03335 [Planctomycetota bacterium]
MFKNWKKGSFGILLLLFLFHPFAFLQGEEEKVTAFVIYQLSNGFPGSNKKNKKLMIPQKVVIYKDRMFIQDFSGHKMIRIVRLDQEKVFELVPSKKVYYVTPFSKFKEFLTKREKERKKLLKRILESSLPQVEKAKRLKEAGLSEDGVDKIEVKKLEEKFFFRASIKARHWKVLKNGIPIFDGFASEEIKYPASLLSFYQAIGIFTEKEWEALKKIKGLPLQVRLWIDLGLKGVYDITNMVTRVAWEPVSPKIFEIPKDYKKYVPPKPKKVCPLCGKAVKDLKYRVVWKGKIYYCCSKKHQIRWMLHCVRKKK